MRHTNDIPALHMFGKNEGEHVCLRTHNPVEVKRLFEEKYGPTGYTDNYVQVDENSFLFKEVLQD